MDDENMRKNHSIRNHSIRNLRHLGQVVACHLIVLTLCSAIFPVSVVGLQETATVAGRVVDEDGQGLSDIEIKVYSSDGAYVQNKRTYSNGYFFVYGLPLGKYTLHFSDLDSKYESYDISVSLTSVGQTDLGDLVLLRALRSSSSALSRVESPGDKVLLPFTVSNIGEESEVVEFLVSKPEGWSTRVLDATGEVTKVYLSSGSSLNLQLEARIPSTSTGNNSLTLTSVGKTNSTLSFTILVKPLDEPIISCRVVDEGGEGIGGVKVEVYSSDESYVESGQTDSKGYFSIHHLQTGTYVIHFSKLGYVEVTKSVTIGDDVVHLGDLVLLRALRSSSSALSRVESPGDKVLLPFTVSNIGEESEVVEFLVSKPEGWSTRVLDATGEVTKVYLSSGSSLNLQLEARIPSTSTGNNSLTLTSVGKTNSTLSFTILVKPLDEPIIFCQFPGKAVEPGETVTFQLRVENPFGMEMRFRVSVDSVPLNWTTFVKSADGEAVTEVTLDSGEFADLILEVTPPVTAMLGEYEISVKAESSDLKVITFLPLNINITKAEEEIEVTATFLEVTAKAGEVAKYPITIINSGKTDTRLFLSVVEPPTDWEVAFKSDTVEVSSLYLKAGESENLVVEVTPPSTVNISSYLVPVQVESADGTSSIRLDLKANIIGSYDLSLAPSTLLTSATVGDTTTFTAKITNTGETPMTTLKLDIEVPEGWDASVTPAQIESLKPRESFTFTIVVEVPDDTVAGDYLLTLKGLSDQVESDEVQIRATASASTSWGLAGIGIIAVILGGLIVVFKKFSRR
ncbi:MAG: NEW3 domain-containing protein [Methanocellales archaeon]|nr:NEW3 domain-containing protein [Methanocellales archaeon]MDD3292297.1 NEW3 domain-containing protein [Methanocellales archaeon]MDD5235593.1 NEW3 domain-containing protein [Methanocellales archaeon]MDD5485760.1 NEW3 domain-containing protein [Methanocellales archaeon]